MNRLVLLAVTALLTVGCTEGGSGTGGRSVFFDLAVEGPSFMAQDPTFTTDTGWEVELHEARVVVGPFYLWENAGLRSASLPTAALPASGSWLDASVRAVHDLVVPTAMAHPGAEHFDGGQLRGEFIGQYALDLLGGEALRLGEARGIAGEVRSVTVILDPPNSACRGDVETLGGAQAWVSGIARKDGTEIEFEGALAIGLEDGQREIQGIPTEAMLDDDGVFVVGVDPRVWFESADFARIESTDADGPRLITDDTQVGVAWNLGARSARAFYTRWAEDGEIVLRDAE